uniref:Uncharacterized protein n=1 Tax=Glossina austeni TaxID=7395 RepID=A0A1A9VVR3_GLOAU
MNNNKKKSLENNFISISNETDGNSALQNSISFRRELMLMVLIEFYCYGGTISAYTKLFNLVRTGRKKAEESTGTIFVMNISTEHSHAQFERGVSLRRSRFALRVGVKRFGKNQEYLQLATKSRSEDRVNRYCIMLQAQVFGLSKKNLCKAMKPHSCPWGQDEPARKRYE